MSVGDVNAIIRAYLVTQTDLTDIVGQRVFCPNLPEGTTLPALGFSVRGGSSNSMTRLINFPSFQFNCWGTSPIEARSIYLVLYDIFQGLGGYYNTYVAVTVGVNIYNILAAEEEVPAQDIQDSEIPSYYKALAFFRVKIEIG